jgi:hypothetical protein
MLIFISIVLYSRIAQTLLGIQAPLSAAEVYLGISYHLSAFAAFYLRLILEELDSFCAAGTFHFKNIFRLPKPLVLPWAFEHLI